jgi:hypothetical protein
VLQERAASWYHGVSPPSHQARLDSLVAALKKLTDRGLTAGCVLANLHHRRVVPLMERPLRVFQMSEDADPVALAKSRLLRDPFLRSYAATRARRAIDLRSGRCNDKDLWVLEMLPVGQLVSGFPGFLSYLTSFVGCRRVLRLRLTPQMVSVSAAKSDPPIPRSRALARAAQQRERERVVRRRERDARHRERRSEEFRLREQQGLSSPGTEEYSSSDEEEEEEEVREQVLPDRWEPVPPSP